MIPKKVYLKLGGLDENLSVECNDVDFCLRAIKAGYLIVWTPFSLLYHIELANRTIINSKEDNEYFWKRWRHLLERGDPYYNPFLTLDSDNYSLNMRPVLSEHHEPYLSEGANISFYENEPIDFESIKKILLIKLDHIGDVILSLPAIQMVRNRFPNAHITMLVGSWAKPIIEKVKEIDEILTFDFFFEKSADGKRSLKEEELKRLEGQLKSSNFDIAIDLRRHPETREILTLSGARYTIGYATGNKDLSLSRCLTLSPDIEDTPSQPIKQHITTQMCRLIQTFYSDHFSIQESIKRIPLYFSSLKERDSLKNLYFPNSNFLIGIHPVAGSSIRQWPVDYFATLADLLIERKGASIILFGIKSEEDIASQIYNLMKHKENLISLIGKISIEEFIGIVSHCHLLIGNNSGPCHIAGIMGVPTLIIFGGQTSPFEWHPLGMKTMSIRVGVNCSPCYWPSPEYCRHDLKCLKLLWPEKVYEAANELLIISGIQKYIE